MLMNKFVLFAGILLLTGCNKKTEQETKPPIEAPSLTQSPHQVSDNASAGVHWTIPSRWSSLPARQMRVATYSIPAAERDDEGGECAVFYFGSDQGGDVKSNIDRWVSQFENPSVSGQSVAEVHGNKVTSVSVSGTYLAPGGPMMQTQGKKENYKLMGAIVEAPEGSVFFKLTGPAKTVDAGKEEFISLIQSIEKK